MIEVAVTGALGKMGNTVCGAVAGAEDMNLAAAVDTAFTSGDARNRLEHQVSKFDSIEECLSRQQVDVAVDFTTPQAVFHNISACMEAGVHCVVGTTGMEARDFAEVEKLAAEGKANCFLAPNFAIGAVLLMEAAKSISRYMTQCEIIELHHDQKLDAPSGTALRTAEMIAESRAEDPKPAGPEGNPSRGTIFRDVPIHSVRLPGLVAHQEVVFGGQGQTLILRHDSVSRESFMLGVLLAVRRVPHLDGLVVGLEKLL